jgi:hypothetical protein
MKNNKYLNLFIIVSVILLILFSIYYIFFNKNEEKIISNIEKYTNIIDIKDTEFPINMIENGSFENGTNIKNYINQDGYNKIIKMKNPSKSGYVLEQKKSNDLTYYELISKSIPNSKYVLLLWISFSNANINSIDLLSLIRIRLRTNNQTNNIPKLNYNIVQKVEINNKSWYLLQYNFTTNEDTYDNMNIYINYIEKLQDDAIYFAGISMYRILQDAQNFIYNNGLVCYLDAYQYESNILTWHDLSGTGNDFFWSGIPITDYTKGFINTSNLDLKGPSSNVLLNNDEFTIILVLNEEIENKSQENSIVPDFRYLLSIPGNNKNSFEISINKENKLVLNLENDKNIVSQKDITLFNKSVITITYKNGYINIYQDGVNILSTQVNNFYFNNNKVILNKNKDLNVNIYGLLVYNRVIKANEMAGIRDYFITNSNKNYNNPDINNIQMDNNLYNNNPINTVSPYYNTVNTQEQYSNVNNNIFEDTFTNQGPKRTCAEDCENMCKNFSKNTDKYNQCISLCKNIFYTCEKYCDEEENDSKYCNSSNNDNENTVNTKCPIAYKKNNNYYVYVYPNSTYAQELNYSGEKSYGKNIDNARTIYSQNFPNCVIPKELRYNGNKNYLDTCPYSLKQLNPCFIDQCYGVNWNVENYTDLNINDKCKKAVSNYCRINYDIDEKCACWNPKYKDSEKCSKMRKFFENPQDYCTPGSFNIEEHPDFNKYIKKDKIPCWGCNIEAPEPTNEKK